MPENGTNTTTEKTSAASASNNNKTEDEDESSLTVSQRYERAIALMESSPQKAIAQLEPLQHEIARLALFSSNESLEDISTKSIPFLALEHCLAMAYTSLPTTNTTGSSQRMVERKRNLLKSIDLWASFLQKLESLGEDLVTPAEQQEYQGLLEYTQQQQQDGGNNNNQNNNNSLPPAPKREDKIARFRAKQQAQQEVQRLKSLRVRRSRLGVPPEEILDEVDEETLDRTVAMTHLLLQKAEALDEWAQTLRELPMIERMAQMEQDQRQMDRHKTTGTGSDGGANQSSNNDTRQRPPAPASGLQVTRISLDPAGQLKFQKEEIKSQVFRPGWTQPTMSLEEFADRERAQAIEREARQKQAEAGQQNNPRRYEQLIKDGMEDNIEAVDASAAVDRAWDDWKEENPRGSGNKRSELGDRNF